MHMFLAKGGKEIAKQKLDQNEELEIALMSIEEVKELMKENKIVQSMHMTCLLYAFEKINELKY
jgi:ADP-ribose pyrophosphatase